MPSSPNTDVLGDDVLLDFYEPEAVERGRAYADADRVSLLNSGTSSIKAVCLGSGDSAYVVQIRWFLGDGVLEIADSCTCPLEGECKHCVAVILTAQRRNRPADQRAGARPFGWPEPAPDWRLALSGLAVDDTPPAPPPQLALQVALTLPRRSRPSRWGADQGPTVTIRPVRRGRAGSWVKTGASWSDVASPYGRFDAHGARQDGPADPLQRSILAALMASARIGAYAAGSQTLALNQFGPDLWHHLRQAATAGMALVDERGNPVVVRGEPVRPEVDLTAAPDGSVTIDAGVVLDGRRVPVDGMEAGLIGAPAHGLWRLDDGGGLELVAFDRPVHPAVARLITEGGLDVPARDVDELLDHYQPALALHASVASSDGSVAITTNQFDGLVVAVERTALDAATLRWFARYRRGDRIGDHPLAALPGRTRDPVAEAAAIEALDLPTHLLPGLATYAGEPADLHVQGVDVITLLAEVLPFLDAQPGVTVEVLSDQPELREAAEAPVISFRVRDGADRRDGNDWFDLDVQVTVEGQPVDFVPLFTALDRGDTALILPSGTWLRIDGPELTRLRELIEEARGLAEPTSDGVARVNRFQTSWWDELAGLGVVVEQSDRWAANVARMGSLAVPEPVPVPARLDATLRPYQQEGLDWLAFLHRHGLGGILADDMGLGKTIQTLALCLHILETKPDARFLVVAPTSVVENWAREAARFAPGVPVAAIRQTKARRGTELGDAIAGASIVVTSYALFRLEFEAYAEHPWELLLLDEAQFVKNHQGKTYQCVRRLEAATKIAITGTPLENSLMDLWSLLSIAAPGLYPDPKRFSDTYRRPIEKGEAPELLATLRRRIAPLMRRRTKDAVLTELPPKTEQTVEVELSPRHARIYQTQLQRQRQKVLGLVGDVQKNRFEILKSLTLLRQLALDPALVDPDHEGVGSAKLDRLLDDLTQVVAEGHRALVFSQFTRYLARVRTRLDAAGIEHAYLDGRTRDRESAIARFKDGGAPVFVISLKAGGFGLNLTEADYCFVLDPWWNPATETQAVDRTHRIGQTNPVVVYRYVSESTIEEKVMELKARKADLFASVVDAEGALSGALTDADIRGLLDLEP